MDQRVAIIQLNVQHFRRKLIEEQDEVKRQVIARLLAEEEAKLLKLAGGSPGDNLMNRGKTG